MQDVRGNIQEPLSIIMQEVHRKRNQYYARIE